MSNSLGKLFTVTSFGESHGDCVGVVVDGCPAGLPLTVEEIQKEVNRRRPYLVAGGTPRAEEDKAEILSGLFNGHTTGAPICLLIKNRNTDSGIYQKIRFTPRPGHADFTAFMKYGGYNDFRGGGMFSGRITATFIMAGAIARKLLNLLNIEILAHTIGIGGIRAEFLKLAEIKNNMDKNKLRCADLKAAVKMAELVEKAASEGDSLGGIVEGIALNMPVGLGEPVFDTLEGNLAKALFAIPAVKGVEFGAGFSVAGKKGSENNDHFIVKDNKIVTDSNNAGGVLGGISSGMPLIVRVVVKPTSSIAKRQRTVNLQNKKEVAISVEGRHDICIVPRAVVVVEAMMAITLCDFASRAQLIPRIIK